VTPQGQRHFLIKLATSVARGGAEIYLNQVSIFNTIGLNKHGSNFNQGVNIARTAPNAAARFVLKNII
jgi:hypothetical protein